MREPSFTKQFKKDYQRMTRQGKRLELLDCLAESLIDELELSARYRDHQLKGKLMGHRECHIQGDWLLIYRIEGEQIFFERTGSHAELFQS